MQDLPEALIARREEVYLSHSFNKLAYNTAAIGPEDLGYYLRAYSQPGAMRCALEVYRAFLEDAGENLGWIRTHGKYRTPAICLSREKRVHCRQAGKMFAEVHEAGTFEVATVPNTGRSLAEENTGGFVDKTMALIRKHRGWALLDMSNANVRSVWK